MLNEKLETALNKQVNLELWSSYLYFSMSYDMKHKGYAGISEWFETQACEELEHAQKIGAHIVNLNGRVLLVSIAAVQQEWSSPKQALDDAWLHEKKVTEAIRRLYELAQELKEYSTVIMLEWFITEQISEEENPRGMMQVLKNIEDTSSALYNFDLQLQLRKNIHSKNGTNENGN